MSSKLGNVCKTFLEIHEKYFVSIQHIPETCKKPCTCTYKLNRKSSDFYPYNVYFKINEKPAISGEAH